MSRFYELMADVNWKEYGGTWYAHDKSAYSKRVYHVVRFLNWEDSTGEVDGHSERYLCMNDDGTYDKPPKHTRPCPYVVESDTIYLDDYTAEQLRSALDTCGWVPADMPKVGTRAYDLLCLEAIIGYYGLGDDTMCASNAYRLLAQAKRRL